MWIKNLKKSAVFHNRPWCHGINTMNKFKIGKVSAQGFQDCFPSQKGTARTAGKMQSTEHAGSSSLNKQLWALGWVLWALIIWGSHFFWLGGPAVSKRKTHNLTWVVFAVLAPLGLLHRWQAQIEGLHHVAMSHGRAVCIPCFLRPLPFVIYLFFLQEPEPRLFLSGSLSVFLPSHCTVCVSKLAGCAFSLISSSCLCNPPKCYCWAPCPAHLSPSGEPSLPSMPSTPGAQVRTVSSEFSKRQLAQTPQTTLTGLTSSLLHFPASRFLGGHCIHSYRNEVAESQRLVSLSPLFPSFLSSARRVWKPEHGCLLLLFPHIIRSLSLTLCSSAQALQVGWIQFSALLPP